MSPKPPASLTLVEVSPPAAPPTFPLTLIHDYPSLEYPLVSLSSAETILALDPTLNTTIHTIAYRLTTTVQQRIEHYTQRLEEAAQQVEQLKQLNTQQNTNN